MFFKKDVFKKFANSYGNTCAGVSIIKKIATLLKRDSWKSLSCEFCETFENTFFIEHLRWLFLKLLNVTSIFSGLQKRESSNKLNNDRTKAPMSLLKF